VALDVLVIVTAWLACDEDRNTILIRADLGGVDRALDRRTGRWNLPHRMPVLCDNMASELGKQGPWRQ
jgi:hypothetical protein